MKRKIAYLLACTVLLVCALSMFVLAEEDNFVDIEGLYAPVEFSFDGDKVAFEMLDRECVLFVASYKAGALVDAAYKELAPYGKHFEVTLSELGLDTADADTVEAFVLSSLTRLKPCCESKKINLLAADARDAYLFVYMDGSMDNGLALSTNKTAPRDNIVSGWILDNRGGTARASIEDSINGVVDVSDTQGSALIREFNEISDAVVTAEFSAVVGGEGNIIEFRDREGNAAYKIRNTGSVWEILGTDGTYSYLEEKDNVGSESFRIVLDFMSGVSTTYINNVCLGEHELLSDNTVNFRFAIDEEGKGVIIPRKTTMTANYGIYENFDTFGIEDVYGWSSSGSAEVVSGELTVTGGSTVSKEFKPIGVKYIADMLAIMPENENITIKLYSSDFPAVVLESRDGTLYANGSPMYELTANMWYRLRIEADPENKTADVVVNGRTIGSVELYVATPVNSLEIASENGAARFDDIKVNAYLDHEDYVPEPSAKADLSDWIVAINVCSLWKDDSQHYGWAYITPYDENKPVLGYYDEGSPESADWEIKYMVEHGIDVQAFCWYADVSTGPLKNPRLSSQLHDGYQLSKYEDYMKYCLIWEAASGNKFKSEQFRNYVIPYWFENYFLDENYFVIDNKPVLHVYAISSIIGEQMFGSREAAAEELAYLEEAARSYGFDGMLYVSNGTIADLDVLGIDAYAAYHWGASGHSYETNVQRNTEQANNAGETNGAVYAIPTISVGYNDFAWRNLKAPLMTVEDYERCHDWVADTYIPTYAEEGTWQEKMVWLSTWNEYGEGTYVMPAEALRGFGYLDVLRNKYTDLDSNHTDDVPTDEQGKRIQYLYPQYARHLRRQGNYQSTGESHEVLKSLSLTSGKVTQTGISGFTVNNGKVSGTSNDADFALYFGDAVDTDISDVDAIRVRMKVPEGSGMKLYYATEKSPALSEAQVVSVTADDDGVKDYMFYIGNKASFDGTLKTLRFDPAQGSDIYFEIYSVEFLNAREVLIVNNCKLISVIDPEEVNGELLFPYDPETGVNYIMHSFINWNHDEKILTIEANNHKVVYTVGKDTFNVDGVEEELGYTLYQVDGLPMISYKTLAEALGYTFRKDGYTYVVETPEIDLYENASQSNADWEFDSFESHGWASGNSDLMVNDGYVRLDNTERNNRDPNMTKYLGEGFDAAKYSSLEVRMKFEHSGSASRASLYFVSNLDSKWDENKRVGARLGTNTSDGEYVTYTIDMLSNDYWYGYITGIRFDPFDAVGYAEIDYIRLIENPDYDEENAEDFNGIINGDAQNTKFNTFTSSSGAVITIEEDPEEEGNYVYRATGTNVKGWTYIKHPYPFENGKTYRVTFRARAVGDSEGHAVDIRLNPNMQYPDNQAFQGIHHEIGRVTLPADGSWVYYEKEFTVSGMTSETDRLFSCYANPPSDYTEDPDDASSATYEIDDIVLVCVD